MATLNDHDLATDDSAGTATTLPAISVTAGDVVVVGFKHEGATDTPSCSDGTAYSVGVAYDFHTAGDMGAAVWYRIVDATGTVTPVITSASRSFRTARAYSFTPAGGTTFELDTSAQAETTGTALSAGTASNAAAGVAVVSFGMYSSRDLTPGSGWTEAASFDITSAHGTEYRLLTGAGSITGDGTIGPSAPVINQMVIFKEVAAAGAAYPANYYAQQRRSR